MILPLATIPELEEEERMTVALLDRMDSADIVCPEKWFNRRDGLLDHLADVRLQLAGAIRETG